MTEKANLLSTLALGAALHADRAAGNRRAPATQKVAVQIGGTENSITALTEAALDGLERQTTPVALHVHRGNSLRQDGHAGRYPADAW